MKKLNKKFLELLAEISLTVVIVGIFAIAILYIVFHLSDYHLDTLELTFICGILGLMIGFVLSQFREIKAESKIEDKQLDSINRDMSNLVEHLNNRARQKNHNR